MNIHPIEKRLRDAFEFEPEIIERVVRAAADQDITYKQFVTKYNVSEPKVFRPKGLPSVHVLDLSPKVGPVEHEVAVLHLPMANGLTRNKIFRSAVFHLANPHQRLIVFANPGVVGAGRHGRLRLRHLPKVGQGDLESVIIGSLEYLKAQGVTETAQFGYSFGADRALALTAAAPRYGVKVNKLTVVEPASVAPKSFLHLARDFKASNKGLRATLRQTDSLLLRDSRPRRSEHFLVGLTALLRPTNLAIARALSKGGFEQRLKAALEAQPDVKVYIAWASESELTPDQLMKTLVEVYGQWYPGQLAHGRIIGKDHSMGDDVALHAALMLQAVHSLERL